jgi:hypothetical protein
VSGSGGSLQEFKLELCSNVVLEKPYLVNNELFPLPPGVGRRIKTEFLLSEDNDNDPDELTYTIVHYPKNGSLYYENSLLDVGSQFNQLDIDNNHIRYVHDGSATVQDSFSFTVIDDAGGWIDITQFQIELDESVVLSTENIQVNRPSIYPNPANDNLNIVFQDPIKGKVRMQIFDINGSLAKSITQNSIESTSIDISTLESGMYILRIETADGSISEKLTILK